MPGGVLLQKRKLTKPKKRRTREHVLADLSANHFERFALQCGFSVERIIHDYGIDLHLFTYDRKGQIENGDVLVQLKATDSMRMLKNEHAVACSVERRDLRRWLREPMPVILVVYDGKADIAYWLYVQAYFKYGHDTGLAFPGAQVTIRIPAANVLDARAVRTFARLKARVLTQVKGIIHYHEEKSNL